MRPVLRATFAARLRARPTAAENSLLSHHTRSKRRPKDGKTLENSSSSGQTTQHIGAWNIVTALPYSSSDTAECQSRFGEAIELCQEEASGCQRGQFRSQRGKAA